jgi:hypothetical protein
MLALIASALAQTTNILPDSSGFNSLTCDDLSYAPPAYLSLPLTSPTNRWSLQCPKLMPNP